MKPVLVEVGPIRHWFRRRGWIRDATKRGCSAEYIQALREVPMRERVDPTHPLWNRPVRVPDSWADDWESPEDRAAYD